ncbi:21073_t:CDS:2, partial [Racocetra persica]
MGRKNFSNTTKTFEQLINDSEAAAEYEKKLKVLLADENGKSPDSVTADSELVRLAKEASKSTRQKLKTHQDALTTAKADALAALQVQKDGQNDWWEKLDSKNPTFTTAQELNAYVLAVSETIRTLKEQEKGEELNKTKKEALNLYSGLVAKVIDQLKINQDLKAAKAQALIDLTALRENSTEELTRYVHVITDAISKVKGADDIKNAKINAANRLDIFRGTLSDNDITTMANEIEPNITSGAVWTQKLQANDPTIFNAEQLSHYVKIITQAINKCQAGHDLKQAKTQIRTTLRNLAQKAGLNDGQVNTKLGLAPVQHANQLIRVIEAEVVAKTDFDTTKGERDNLENQIKLVRRELSIGATVTDVNDLVKKTDLTAAEGKLTQLKNDLRVIKNDNTIDTARVNQIKDNEAELTRINNDIIAKIKTKTNLKTLIKLNANNKNELDTARLDAIETILSTPANANAADVAKYKVKLQGLGIAAGYSDFSAVLAELTNLKTEKSDFQNKLSQQEENCRKEKEAFQVQIEQKEQDLLKLMVEQLELNLTGDKYERQQVLDKIKELVVKPDTNQETNLVNLRQQIAEQEKEITKLREQDKENHPTSEVIKERAENMLKDLNLENSTYQTELAKITSLSELTNFYQKLAKNEIAAFSVVKIKGSKALGKK